MADYIDAMYRRIRRTDNTEDRILIFENEGIELPDIDNYSTVPGDDPEFEKGWHRWFHLFQLTKGVERATIMNIAFELHRSSPNPHLHGVGFFNHGFSDSTRDFYYAKAMCLANRPFVEPEPIVETL